MKKNVIFFIIFVLILFFSYQCNTPSDDGGGSSNGGGGSSDSSNVTILSIWGGTFEYYDNNTNDYGVGTISNWKIMSDNTVSGLWTADCSISFSCNATYTLSGTDFTFSGSGVAKDINNNQDNFTINGSGTIEINDDEGTGVGTCTIVFDTWTVGPIDCEWEVTMQ